MKKPIVTKGRPVSLPTASLVLERRLQMREKGEENEQIEAIMEAIKAGVRVPRVRVRVVKVGMGADPLCYVVDGFHTVKAYQRLNKKTIPCDVKHGTFTDALLDAAAANREHLGLRRTRDDKRRAVEAILALDESREWSNPRIADHVGVSKEFVREVRQDAAPATVGEPVPEPAARVGRDGRQHPAAGKRKASEPAAEPIQKQTFDWKGMESHLGAIIRGVDQAAGKHGVPQAEAASAHRLLNELTKYVNSWAKRFAK